MNYTNIRPNWQSMQQMHMPQEMITCIQECQNCENVCTMSVNHCLGLGGEHAAQDHIRLMLDCAEMCRTSAGMMLRMSPLHSLTCGICAEFCERCADDCEKFKDDPMMQQCAIVCRSCAQSCRSMATMHH